MPYTNSHMHPLYRTALSDGIQKQQLKALLKKKESFDTKFDRELADLSPMPACSDYNPGNMTGFPSRPKVPGPERVLSPDAIGLTALSDAIQKQQLKALLKKKASFDTKFDRELADAVLEVAIMPYTNSHMHPLYRMYLYPAVLMEICTRLYYIF